jgi:hypothetical protein
LVGRQDRVVSDVGRRRLFTLSNSESINYHGEVFMSRLYCIQASGIVAALAAGCTGAFAQATGPQPGCGKHAIFETWYSENEAFATGPEPQAVGPRQVKRRFRNPQQLQGLPGQPAPQAAGSELLSEVMFNYPNYNHIRSRRFSYRITSLLYGRPELQIGRSRITGPFLPSRPGGVSENCLVAGGEG